MIREMNKDIFRENLRNTLEEINHKMGPDVIFSLTLLNIQGVSHV